jgi:hypothetical protein
MGGISTAVAVTHIVDHHRSVFSIFVFVSDGCLLDGLPSGRVALWTGCPLDRLPSGRVALWTGCPLDCKFFLIFLWPIVAIWACLDLFLISLLQISQCHLSSGVLFFLGLGKVTMGTTLMSYGSHWTCLSVVAHTYWLLNHIKLCTN